MQYKLWINDSIILKIDDTKVYSVPNTVDNRDWMEYQAWLAADPVNNIPLPADS